MWDAIYLSTKWNCGPRFPIKICQEYQNCFSSILVDQCSISVTDGTYGTLRPMCIHFVRTGMHNRMISISIKIIWNGLLALMANDIFIWKQVTNERLFLVTFNFYFSSEGTTLGWLLRLLRALERWSKRHTCRFVTKYIFIFWLENTSGWLPGISIIGIIQFTDALAGCRNFSFLSFFTPGKFLDWLTIFFREFWIPYLWCTNIHSVSNDCPIS